MEHSKYYYKVKAYYDMKMWNESRVRNAVKMNWITEAEFEVITGKVYEEILTEEYVEQEGST